MIQNGIYWALDADSFNKEIIKMFRYSSFKNVNPFHSDPGRKEKINLNFYFPIFVVPQKVS